ncbi:unnamed protein product [Vitrella brassicaformis CCMP3155]|uniref:Uncharacterized protein n=1 Tax=Vitrella brassicaformis (strain CCMP3155) TaxID=1169540 RepID=A0A0G4GIK3_VITBC|nr:unnamed protein product [Vitrella brassicaformis CCMP3155]|eukprot:CEM29666.1 unnamed protein product [Vitrella brassicaformis CCMP3155]
MIEAGETDILVEAGFVSTLISLLDTCERIGTSVSLCLICLKSLITGHRKVLETDGLAEALCGALLKEARGEFLHCEGLGYFRDVDRMYAIDLLKGLVSYGRSLGGKTAHNPYTRQILQLESVKAMRARKNNINVPPQVSAFFDSLAHQDKRDSKAKSTQPSLSDAQLAAKDREAQRRADELIEEERREKAAKTKKNNKAKKGKASESAVEPSLPSTAAPSRSSSTVVEEDVEPPTPSSSSADTSVPSVALAADGGQREGLIESTANEESDDNNGDSDDMLINSAFGQHARQNNTDSHKTHKTGKQGMKDLLTPTPDPKPLPPPRPSTTSTEKGQGRHGKPRLSTATASLPAAVDGQQHNHTNTSTNKKQTAAPPRFGQGSLAPFAKVMVPAEVDDDKEGTVSHNAAQWAAANAPPETYDIELSLKPVKDIDALEDGLFSNDMQTYMASAQGVTASVGELPLPVLRLNPKSPEFVKRVAARLGRDREAFRRILMRLVDERNKECQVATADMLYRLVSEGLLSFVAPSDITHMVQEIWTVVGVDLASKGVLVELRGEVKSLVAFQLIGTLPTDKPFPPVDVVLKARMYLMRCGLKSARNSLLQTHKATICQVLSIVLESGPQGVGSEAIRLVQAIYEPSPPVTLPVAVAVEVCSMFVEALQLPADQQPAGARDFFAVMFNATTLWMIGEEEWSVVRAALSSHVYSHFGGLVDLIAHRPASTYTRWAASLTLGTFIHASLTLCIKRRKADGHALIEIEQHGVDKVLSPAPMPMEPLRRLVLDAVAREGLVTAASLD